MPTVSRFTRVFFLLGLLFGLLWVFITPPCQVPDENEHFLRAYQISEGEFVSVVENGQVGGHIPPAVYGLVADFKGPVAYHGEVRFDRELFQAGKNTALESDPKPFSVFSNSTGYSPIAYLGGGAGIFIARHLGLSLMAGFWLGRAMNLVLCLLICALALEIAPAWNAFLAVCALTPMGVFQRSSFSADALTNALALLVFSLVLRFCLDPRWRYQGKKKWLFLLASAALPLCKPSYALISTLLFVLMPPGRWKGGGKAWAREFIAYCACVGAPTLLWLSALKGLPLLWRGNPAVQVDWLKHHAFEWFGIVGRSFFDLGHDLPNGWVGILGWGDTAMPGKFWVLFMICTLWVLAIDRGFSRNLRFRSALIVTTLLTVILVLLPLFITWTHPGMRTIEGLQGRYFIPVAPLFFLGVWPEFKCLGRRKNFQAARLLAALGSLGFLAFATVVLYARYYGNLL